MIFDPRKLAVVVIALASVSIAQADPTLMTYTYTGDLFDQVTGPQFSTSDRITGSFTIDCGLAGGAGDCTSLPLTDIELFITSISFTASGSPAVVIDSMGSRDTVLYIETDSSGNIVYWRVAWSTDNPDCSKCRLSTQSYIGSEGNVIGGDSVTTFPGDIFFDAGHVNSVYPGTWSSAPAKPVIPVNIDIKPGGDPNCFNINGHGAIPVAVLSDATFDAADIDVTTLSFGGLDVRVRGNKWPLCSLEDVTNDGLNDLVCQFQDDPENWDVGEDEATLTGALIDGTEIEGTDSICIAPIGVVYPPGTGT